MKGPAGQSIRFLPPDLVTANYGEDSVSVLLNQGDGTFQAAMTYPVGNRPLSLIAADLNGDGKARFGRGGHHNSYQQRRCGVPRSESLSR